MKILILLFTILSASAQMVEIKMPEFSQEVQKQATEKKNQPSDHCTVDSATTDQGLQAVSCGTEKKTQTKKPKLGDLGGDNSQFAQDKVRENNNRRR